MTVLIYTQDWDKGLTKLQELVGQQALLGNYYTYRTHNEYQLSVYFENMLLIKLIFCQESFSCRGLKYHEAWIDSNLSNDFIQQWILPAGAGHWNPDLQTISKGKEFYF